MKDWTPEEVRAFRESLGMSREQMAVTLGISAATIYRWEHDKPKKGPSTLAKRALDGLEAAQRRKR